MSEKIGDWWLVATHAFSRRSGLSRLSRVDEGARLAAPPLRLRRASVYASVYGLGLASASGYAV